MGTVRSTLLQSTLQSFHFPTSITTTVTMRTLGVSLVVMLMAVAMVSGELLAMLRKLQQHDGFNDLSVHDQIFLTDLIAAAETCKLTEMANVVGRDEIVRVISHVNGDEHDMIQTYLTNHKQSEANGTCTIQ